MSNEQKTPSRPLGEMPNAVVDLETFKKPELTQAQKAQAKKNSKRGAARRERKRTLQEAHVARVTEAAEHSRKAKNRQAEAFAADQVAHRARLKIEAAAHVASVTAIHQKRLETLPPCTKCGGPLLSCECRSAKLQV